MKSLPIPVILLAAFFRSALAGDCLVPPCGRIENKYGANVWAMVGDGSYPFECNIWNGDGGNVERPDRQHCSGWQVPWLGSLGGFYYDRTDVDFFSYWGIRHTAYWTQTKTLRQVGPYEWTKITSKETAVCENVNEKPYCKITGIW